MLWQQRGLGRVGDGALTPPTNIPLPRTAGRTGGQRCCSLPPPPPTLPSTSGWTQSGLSPFLQHKIQLDTRPGSWTDTDAGTAGEVGGVTPFPHQRGLCSAQADCETPRRDPSGRDGLAGWTFGEILAEAEQLERDYGPDIRRCSC